MAKKVATAVLDAPLDHIINNCDALVVCEGEPADYAAATTLKSNGGAKLGDVAMGSGDFSKAAGDTSGRKLTVASQTVTIDEDGSADHVALVDDTNSVLLHVTTMSVTSVSAGQDRTVESYDEEFEDPT